jgi:hypothetical protein
MTAQKESIMKITRSSNKPVEKIIRTGSYNYMRKVSRDLAKQGYCCVADTKHPDGNHTMTFEYVGKE